MSSHRSQDILLYLRVNSQILIGHRAISQSFQQEVIIVLTTHRNKDEGEPAVWAASVAGGTTDGFLPVSALMKGRQGP